MALDLRAPIVPTVLRVRDLQTGQDLTQGDGSLPTPSIFDRVAAANLARAMSMPRAGQRLSPAMRDARMAQPATPPAPTAPAAPSAPMGFFDRLPSPMSPAGRGLGAAASTLLQASGYSATPVTLGQALGAAGAAGMEAMTAAEAAQQDRAYNQMMLNLKLREALMPDLTPAQKDAAALGLKPGEPEYDKYIRERTVQKPDTIFMGGDKQQEMAYAAALATRKQMSEQVGRDTELATRLSTVIDLLSSSDVSTGRVQSALLPIKQLGRELGFLSDEDIKELSEQEIITSAAAFLTPRMRVVGSGSTSDREMTFFANATVKLANTPEANLVIATMQKQVMDYNKRRLNLFDQFLQERGNAFGFEDYADQQMGSVYQTASNNEEFNRLIDEGKIRKGDVFYNGGTNEFDIYDPEEMG